MAITGSIEVEQRRAELVRLARGDGLSLEHAARRFGVSSMTIRRDLEALERAGEIRRVRGGAIAPAEPRSYPERLELHAAAKRVIAKKALSLLPSQGALACDASTTIAAIAAELGGRGEFTVCTNSTQTFEVLARQPGLSALLTGGALEPETGSLVGPLANASARALRTELFFMSAAGLDAKLGTSEASLAEAEVKRVFAAAAARTVLCIDSSKLGARGAGGGFALDEVAVLVTELDADDGRLDAYRGSLTIL